MTDQKIVEALLAAAFLLVGLAITGWALAGELGVWAAILAAIGGYLTVRLVRREKRIRRRAAQPMRPTDGGDR
ncbi:hypothetical protein [Pseudonocardia sp. ICBG601]|uniref:hypothetical protein n=1 Tax=Pseudonocardia sp. ICBG601 TaxID=2846759 RepID=UPI001CF69C7B|nr:hypothetical protein [Pseudonocardia sp. ICBG601]